MGKVPWTLAAGAALIAAAQMLLFVDVWHRGGVVIPPPEGVVLPRPGSPLQWAARWTAINMTVLGWVGYLLVADGLLQWTRDGSPIRRRPNRFIVAWLTSVPVWCLFDTINFYFMDAWRYHGLPPAWSQRLTGYFIAFAAISPGMFLAAELYQRLGLGRLNAPCRPVAHGLSLGVPLLLGAIALGLTVAAGHTTVLNLVLWIALIYLLDPINRRLGAPSLIGDWYAGRWGRTLALFAGGATCGLLWEFWNYWALAKWTYHLPFLGPLERVRYFEMPLAGFLGFLPFAAECWVMLNTIVALLERGGLRVAEPLADDGAVL